MNIELTPQEAQAAVNLIDAAIKAHGAQVAEIGMHLIKQIKAAAEAEAAIASSLAKAKAAQPETNEENGHETTEGPDDKPETDIDADGSGSDHPAGGAG